MIQESEIKWAIFSVCESIQRVTGTKFTRKESMRQIMKELMLLSSLDKNSRERKNGDRQFTCWQTRRYVKHRFKTMMNMNGIRRGKIY